MKKLLLLILLISGFAYAQDCSIPGPNACRGLGAPTSQCLPGWIYTQVDASGNTSAVFACGGIPPGWHIQQGGGSLPPASQQFLGSNNANQLIAAPYTPVNIRDAKFPVTRYGAACDGVTDDTTAIQSAITAASQSLAPACGNNSTSPTQSCSAVVLVPHLCTSVITNIQLPSYVSIEGESRFSSVLLEKNAGNSNMITVASATSTIRTAVRNLTLNGNASNQTGGPWHCIDLDQNSLVGGVGSPRHVIENNNIQNCSGDGIHINGDAGSDVVSDNFVHNNGNDGIYFHAPDSHIVHNESYLNGGYGFEDRVGADESAHNKAWGNTLQGYFFTGIQWRSEGDEAQQNVLDGAYENSCDRCMLIAFRADGNAPSTTGGGLRTFNATNGHFQIIAAGQDGTSGSVQPYALANFTGSGNANNTYIVRSASPGVADYLNAPDPTEKLEVNGALVSDDTLDAQQAATVSVNPQTPGLKWNEHYWNGTAGVTDSWRSFVAPNPSSGTAVQSQLVIKYGGSLTPVVALSQPNTASVSNNYNSPAFQLNASCWTGSVGQSTVWNWQVVEGSGASPTDTFTLTNNGTCNATPRVAIPYSTTVGNIFNMSTATVNLITGKVLNFYSDSFVTLKAKVDASVGLGQFSQLQVTSGGLLVTQMISLSTASITPTAVTANTCSDQSFTLTGATASSNFWTVKPPAAMGNLTVPQALNNGANSVTFHFCNPSAASVTPPAGVYSVVTVN